MCEKDNKVDNSELDFLNEYDLENELLEEMEMYKDIDFLED